MHYASMPNAHSDAHRDAADARAAILNEQKAICQNCCFWRGQSNGRGYCDKIKIDENVGVDSFSIDLYADDDQGLRAHLLTGPNFGCVQFIAK